MCTAVVNCGDGNIHGRTLDAERDYGERFVITPRNYVLRFSEISSLTRHYAIIGIGISKADFPLYFDAVNECGIYMAALNFPISAYYRDSVNSMNNIASFELIPWLLSGSADMNDVKMRLAGLNVTKRAVSHELPPSPLHWIVAKESESLVIESTSRGVEVYENTLGVLTNEPSFRGHLARVERYSMLTPKQPENRLIPRLGADYSSLGLGGIGLPGDHSSESRFIRALFTRENTEVSVDQITASNDLFHILEALSIPRGCVRTESGEAHYTRYMSVADGKNSAYYCSDYTSRRVRRVTLSEKISELSTIVNYPIEENI